MAEEQFENVYVQREKSVTTERKDMKIFRIISLVALTVFWIGYGYALYRDNSGNTSYYLSLITIFSILNADILFTRKKLQNKVLNIYTKILGILFCVLAFYSVISVILS